jgi:hypothetical protein
VYSVLCPPNDLPLIVGSRGKAIVAARENSESSHYSVFPSESDANVERGSWEESRATPFFIKRVFVARFGDAGDYAAIIFYGKYNSTVWSTQRSKGFNRISIPYDGLHRCIARVVRKTGDPTAIVYSTPRTGGSPVSLKFNNMVLTLIQWNLRKSSVTYK